MGSQPVRRPNQNLSASDLRAVNSAFNAHQAKMALPRFTLLVQSNTLNHSFGATARGNTWQDAVNDWFGDGADADHSRKAVRVVSVHDCDFPFQANNANRLDN